jgi:hypothetical protein
LVATQLSALETIVRRHLSEPTASHWESDELIDLMNLGFKDLWRSINDLHQEHFCTVDATNVSQAADGTSLTGVPADVARVHLIEPRDLSSSGTSRNLSYRPLDYAHPMFQAARASEAVDPSSCTIWYTLHGAGGPVAAPTIYVAPKVTSTVNLTLVYVPTLAAKTSANDNPIPGESDQAIVAWTVAHARAKERDDRAQDPSWLTIYATEKQNLLVSLTPRQTQEPQIVEALFEAWWS